MSRFFHYHDYFRKHFGKYVSKTGISPLSNFYKKSYLDFLQAEKHPIERQNYGLEKLLRSIFPLEYKHSNARESTTLREIYFYSHYVINPPEWSEEECKVKGISYLLSINVVTFKVTLKDYVFEESKLDPDSVKNIEKLMFVLWFKGIPSLTKDGTFLINGIERAILAQLQRCPGIYYQKKSGICTTKIVPYYGTNVQLEMARSDKMFIRVLGKRRIPLVTFLHGIGIAPSEILSIFTNPFRLRKSSSMELFKKSKLDELRTRPLYDMKRFLYGFASSDVFDIKTKKIRIPAGALITDSLFTQILSSKVQNYPLTRDLVNGIYYCNRPKVRYLAKEDLNIHRSEMTSLSVASEEKRKRYFLNLHGVVYDPKNIMQQNHALSEKQVLVEPFSGSISSWVFCNSVNLSQWKRKAIDILGDLEGKDYIHSFSKMIHDFRKDNSLSHQAFLCSEKERLELLRKMFFDSIHFNLSEAGRAQVNQCLELPQHCKDGSLTKVDFFSLCSFLVRKMLMPSNPTYTDNIYQLQNRKVRLPGELLGHLLLKSFLQIRRKKEFGLDICSNSFRLFRNLNKLNKYHLENPQFKKSLPEKVKVRVIASNLLEHEDKVSSTSWNTYRNFLFFDSTDKLTQTILQSVKRQVDNFLTGSNLSQLLDQLNPLSELTHLRRLSLLGPDGLNKDNVSLDTRDVQSSFFGKICPIETPEGKAVGIVNSISLYCRINSSGDLLTPYLKVRHGVVQSEVHYLSSRKESDYAIAQFEELTSESMRMEHTLIYCRYKDQFIYLDKNHVDYVDASPKQMLSLSSSLIPFLEHNDGNRALMGSNMQRQAVPSLAKEISLIGTGSEDLIANYRTSSSTRETACWLDNLTIYSYRKSSNHNSSTDFGINLSSIEDPSNNGTSIYSQRDRPYKFPIVDRMLKKYEKVNQKSYKHESLRIDTRESFLDFHRALNFTGTENGQLAIGHNILVGFMSMNGYSFEDSIVISDRLLKDSLFSSIHTKELVVFDWASDQKDVYLTRNIPSVSERDTQYLDSFGIIKSGSPLSGGDILVGKVLNKSRAKKKISERDKFLQDLIGSNKDLIKDVSERAPIDIEGCVLDVKKYYSFQGEEISYRYQKDQIQSHYQSFKLRNTYLTHFFLITFFTKFFEIANQGILLSGIGFFGLKLIRDMKPSKILSNTIASITKANQWKIVRSSVQAVAKRDNMLWSSMLLHRISNIEIRSQEHSMLQRNILFEIKKIHIINSILNKELKLWWYEKHLSVLFKSYNSLAFQNALDLVKNKNAKNKTSDRGNLSGIAKMPLRMIKILIAYKHKPKPGDKMTGRHGNKGVISQVLPIHDMPYTSQGTSLDIVLNPIGISSRMNLGQVFEVHLGFASIGLSQEIHKLLRIHNPDYYYFDIRSFLYHLYGNTKEQRIISKLSNKQLQSLLKKISHGIPIATTPFSGASDFDVKDYLQLANIDPQGQVEVYDGRTGQKFDRKITIGYMYVLKLNHLVDDKIHSRFTGPYNRVTEQPLGGKSLHGGQRFGEMEVWALQSYGAAYTLLDMITVKSDSRLSHMESRRNFRMSKMSTSKKIRKTFPEAFNVLIRELWCLGLVLKIIT